MQDLEHWTPRLAPQAVILEGRYVTLLPYQREKHGPELWEAFGGLSVNQLLAYFACPDFHTELEFHDWLDAVEKGGWVRETVIDNKTGKAVGMAHYMRPDPANGVVEVGGVAHGSAMAGTPLSTELHYLMARHVFDSLGYRRYEWKCHNENIPSKRAAERYGFIFEGVFRQHMLSRGKNRDTAWYSMIDSEWPLLKAAFEAWLRPENFDSKGQQIKSLPELRQSIAESGSAE